MAPKWQTTAVKWYGRWPELSLLLELGLDPLSSLASSIRACFLICSVRQLRQKQDSSKGAGMASLHLAVNIFLKVERILS